MWQKVTKFKGAEYFRKALYVQYAIDIVDLFLWARVFFCVPLYTYMSFSLSVFR